MNDRIKEYLSSDDLEMKQLGARLLENENLQLGELKAIMDECTKGPFTYHIFPDIHGARIGIEVVELGSYTASLLNNMNTAWVRDPTKLLKLKQNPLK